MLWISLGSAQDSGGSNYLSAALRAQVDSLQQTALQRPTDAANLKQRLDTLWPWVNAYALTGGPVPVNATLQIATAYRALEALRLEGTRLLRRCLQALTH